MGGAVSSGESNDELIDNLMESDYIKTTKVEHVFRAVDRALYYTDAFKSNAYKDLAWKDGNLHLSAPCIYSVVLENLKLEKGTSFLNMGSGTGYFSTLCGLMIGKNGINHGIELHPEVAEYGRDKLEEFLSISPAIDGFDFCMPEFVVGNCLNPISSSIRYERIYCGAACPEEMIRNVTDLLKVGGICVMPVNDSLMQITRISETTSERKSLLPVSFATLIAPPRGGTDKKPVVLPKLNPLSLKELCRMEIRGIIRSGFMQPDGRMPPGKEKKKRRHRRRQLRQEQRRRASRLLVVQRRQSAGDDGETGFVAVAYSLGNDNSSGDEYYDGGLVVHDNHDHEDDEEGMNDVLSPATDTDDTQTDSDNEMPALEGDNVPPPPPPQAQASTLPEPVAPAPSTSSSSSSAVPPTPQSSSSRPHSILSRRNDDLPLAGEPDNNAPPGNGFLGANGSDTFLRRIRELYQRREQRGGFRQLSGLIDAVQSAAPFMRARAAANAAAASTSTGQRSEGSPSNYDSACHYSSHSSLTSSTISTSSNDTSPSDDSDEEMDGRRINPNHLFSKNGHHQPISGSAESGVVVTDSPERKDDDDQDQEMLGDEGDDADADAQKGKSKKMRKRKKAGSHKKTRYLRGPLNPPPAEVFEEMEREAEEAERRVAEEDAEEALLDNTPAGRLKRNPASVEMRTRIGQLPMLPPPVKLYLNFYRQLDLD